MATPAAEGTAARKRALERAGESEIEGPRKKKVYTSTAGTAKKAGYNFCV